MKGATMNNYTEKAGISWLCPSIIRHIVILFIEHSISVIIQNFVFFFLIYKVYILVIGV